MKVFRDLEKISFFIKYSLDFCKFCFVEVFFSTCVEIYLVLGWEIVDI